MPQPDQNQAMLRRQSWRGLKAPVKRVASWRIPHLVMRQIAQSQPHRLPVGRLPAPAHVRKVRADMAGVTFDMLRPDRCILAKELYWGHGRRPDPSDQMALEVFARLASDADVVLDVGAYTGVFSLLAAKVSPRSSVHAFEVVPSVAQAALANVVANDLVERVQVHLMGVGAPDTVAHMALGQGGSALPDFYSAQMSFTDGVRIPIRSLDQLMHVVAPASDARRVVVKIDTEGGEALVLRHGAEFLARYEVDFLCEVLEGVADVPYLREFVAEHGLRCYRVEGTGLRPMDVLTPSADYRDWVFSASDPDALIARGVTVIR